jgi:type VI secretion system protein ImpH
VAVEELVGDWISLPEDCHCRLGESPRTGTLGHLTLIGERVWDCAQTFRIVLGPVGLPQFLPLLPGGDSLRCLTALVRNYVGDELAWELTVILRKEEVPPTRLGECGQLGWTTWLACESRGRDADDMLLRPMTAGEMMNHE